MTQPDLTMFNSDMPKHIDRLIQALSGIRSLSNIEIKDILEQQLYQTILKSVLSYVDLDKCSLFLHEDGVFKCAAGLGWGDQYNNSIPRLSNSHNTINTINTGEGILGLCAESRTLIHCRDCSSDPNFISLPVKNREKIGSLISTPLISCNELLGIINISHPQANFFEPWHEKVMMTYANLIAQIIHNHRLIHTMESEIHAQTRELKNALKESEELKVRYQELSFIDYLTELHNRRYFFPEFSSAVANAKRNGHTISLLILDLDSFKAINDNFGHEVGDKVLIGVSQLLKRQIRKGDMLVRLGGEEFAIALIGTDIQAAKQFGDRLRVMISELKWSHHNYKVQVSACIGISELKDFRIEADETVREMMAEADLALYYCKQNGRNQTISHDDAQSMDNFRNMCQTH